MSIAKFKILLLCRCLLLLCSKPETEIEHTILFKNAPLAPDSKIKNNKTLYQNHEDVLSFLLIMRYFSWFNASQAYFKHVFKSLMVNSLS